MLLPITACDGNPVGSGANMGKPGNIFQQMHRWIWDYQQHEFPLN